MSGDSSSPQNGQPSPQDGQAQQQQESGQRRDPTAEGPREGDQPKPGEGQQPQPDENGDPKGNQPDQGQGQQLADGETPDSATEDGSARSADADVWGNLPIHLRDIFRAEGGDDMPAQYRDWIDAYYRRLNESAGDR